MLISVKGHNSTVNGAIRLFLSETDAKDRDGRHKSIRGSDGLVKM
jgi:hypothetical protein